ncbi:hypothetical protein RSOL_283430, partial [Rhizoctonia solani AG-3 Rhs1AP]
MPRAASKRELEEPGDINVAHAPAAPKKIKAASVGDAKKTHSATKQAKSNENDDQTTLFVPTTTKVTRNKKPTTNIQKASQTPDDLDLTPIEPPPSATEGKKSSWPKQLSAIAGKANKQAVAKQNSKETQAAKKAKKAEAAVIEETPEEMAAFLAKIKGQLQPPKARPQNCTQYLLSEGTDAFRLQYQLGCNPQEPDPHPEPEGEVAQYDVRNAEDNDSQTNSTRTVQQYEALLAGVNADSDDSEVKARRAGALPDTNSSSKAAVKVWMSESDEEATKDEGEGEGEAEPEVEDDGRDGDDSEAEESGGMVSTAENEGEADEEYNGGVGESDVDLAPTKPRHHRFFDADGGLSSPAGSESNGEADSDGEGASGAVATQVDGDQTMMTAVASDSEDD